jgi:hypothetical protein
MSEYYQTTRDILHGFEQLHRQLARHYQRMGDSAAQERLKLLLDYLRRNEKRLQITLHRAGESTDGKVLNTWYRDAPALDQVLATLAPPPPENLDTLVDQVLRLNQHLVELFEQLAANGPTEAVQALFANLAEQERQSSTQLQRATLSLQDI